VSSTLGLILERPPRRVATKLKRKEENRIPKRVLYMNFRTRMRGRPRNRWQDEVREVGRIVGREGWQEKVHNREEWKKFLRTARNHRILHMPTG
jgi:L,D-peptidoglycan transpeptidase YkuD (ErfK/YbiS/YcfS/YnhG family)